MTEKSKVTDVSDLLSALLEVYSEISKAGITPSIVTDQTLKTTDKLQQKNDTDLDTHRERHIQLHCSNPVQTSDHHRDRLDHLTQHM